MQKQPKNLARTPRTAGKTCVHGVWLKWHGQADGTQVFSLETMLSGNTISLRRSDSERAFTATVPEFKVMMRGLIDSGFDLSNTKSATNSTKTPT